MRGKGWTIHLPRRRCPVCGAELECAFNGKFTIRGRMTTGRREKAFEGSNPSRPAKKGKVKEDDGEMR